MVVATDDGKAVCEMEKLKGRERNEIVVVGQVGGVVNLYVCCSSGKTSVKADLS